MHVSVFVPVLLCRGGCRRDGNTSSEMEMEVDIFGDTCEMEIENFEERI